MRVRVNHLTSPQVYSEIESAQYSGDISAAAAITIASWWQSPSTTLVSFASGCEVDKGTLLRDIRHEYVLDNAVELTHLYDWVLRYDG